MALCASAIESVRLLLNSRSTHVTLKVLVIQRIIRVVILEQAPSLIVDQYLTVWVEYDSSLNKDPFCRPAGGIVIPRFQNVGVLNR